MPYGRLAREQVPNRGLFWLTAVTFALALVVGGGQGSLAEHLLALAGLSLIVTSGLLAISSDTRPDRARWFWLLPAALLALPLLQLVPLPAGLWTRLPGRQSLVDGLGAAGILPTAAAWTVSPIDTETVLWSALVPAGVFMGAAMLRSTQRRTLVGVSLAFAAISAVLGLWQLMEGAGSALYVYRITNKGEAVGLFANRNHLAGFLAASLPVAAGLLADRLRQHVHGVRDLQAWLLAALLVLLSISVTATHSRAGFGLLMVSVLASAAILFSGRKTGSWARARPWLRISAVIAGLMIVQFTLYGMLVRLESDPLDDHRWTLAGNTLQAAEPAHGTGFGLGTFVHAYDEIGDASADMPSYVNHAHDDYLELWLEGGVPAMLLTLTALTMVGWQLRKQWNDSEHEGAGYARFHGLRIGTAFALILIALHSIVDYPLRTLTIATYSGLLAAVLLGSARGSSRE